MIYLLAIAIILTIFGFALKVRRRGFLAVTLDMAIAAVAGYIAGLFIGIGARAGMSAITIANGDAPNITTAGSIQVIVIFAGLGIVLGLIYEAFFRDLLRRSGLLYGFLIMLCVWYPGAESGVQLLRFQPTIVSLIFFSGACVAFMFLPFAIALEAILSRWHQRSLNEILVGSLKNQ